MKRFIALLLLFTYFSTLTISFSEVDYDGMTYLYPSEAIEQGLIPKIVQYEGISLNIEELAKIPYVRVTSMQLDKYGHGYNLFSLGLISGVGNYYGDTDKLLGNDLTFKREEIVTILVKLENALMASKFVSPKTPSFSDVPITHWAYPYIEEAKALGITNGIGNGKFGLGEELTYKQTLVFLANALGKPIDWDNAVNDAETKLQLESDGGKSSSVLTRRYAFELIAKALFMQTSEGKMLIDKLAVNTDIVKNLPYYKTKYTYNAYIRYMTEHNVFLGLDEDTRESALIDAAMDEVLKQLNVPEQPISDNFWTNKDNIGRLLNCLPDYIMRYYDNTNIVIGQDSWINKRIATLVFSSSADDELGNYVQGACSIIVQNYTEPGIRVTYLNMLRLFYGDVAAREIVATYESDNGQLDTYYTTSTGLTYIFTKSKYTYGIETKIFPK